MQHITPPVQGISAGNASHLSTFMFGLASVRVVVIDSEPWFVGKDVADVLGYLNTRKAIRDHCKSGRPVGVNESFPPLDPQTTIIPERDVYRLVMRSKLPAAEKFEEWVVGEILPTVRKTGQYSTQAKPVIQLPDFTDPVLAARAWADAKESERIEHACRVEAEGALAIAAPKAAALDLISAGHDAVTITEAVKVLGIKRAVLVARMHADGWIYRQNQSWVAYDQHIKNGRLQYKEARYTDEKTEMECVKPYCHVTPKGLARLAQVFAAEVVA